MSSLSSVPRFRTALATALAATLILAATVPAQQPDRTAAGAPEAVRAFKAALAAGDSTAAVGWLHPDVTIFEGGVEDLSAYRAGHLAADMAFLQAVKQEIITFHIEVSGEMALYTSQSRSTGEFRGRAIDSRGLETISLQLTSDGWRLRHIHWSSGR